MDVCIITSTQAVLNRETSGSRLDGLTGEVISAAFSNYREEWHKKQLPTLLNVTFIFKLKAMEDL